MAGTRPSSGQRHGGDELVEELLGGVLRVCWDMRVELVLLTVTAGGWAGLVRRFHLPPVPSAIAVAVVWVGLLAAGPSRRLVFRVLHAALVRRRFVAAVRAAEISGLRQQVPYVSKVRPTAAGDALHMTVPRGATVKHLEDAAEAIAAGMAVRNVRVERDPRNARKARAVIVRRDPLADPVPLAWPEANTGRRSLWQPIPVGVDDDGETVTVTLPERNLLLGGEPGAGKSGALNLLVAAAALDPSVKLWLLDGKLVELAAWAGCAERSVGVSVADAVDVLGELRAEMERRYQHLLSSRRRKVSEADGDPLHVVVCDELAHYLTAGDRNERAEFADAMRDLVSRGRAAGVIVLAATQKPGSDIVPTALRDLFGFRWALRCSTPQASDTILGSGWASQGFTASDVDAGARGVGLLLHEGGRPVRLRSFWLDDHTIDTIATRGETLRRAPT